MAHALTAMKAMAGEIGDERQRLESVSYATSDNARDLATRLAAERHALEALARELRSQISTMTEAIPRQAQMMISAARQASDEVARADSRAGHDQARPDQPPPRLDLVRPLLSPVIRHRSTVGCEREQHHRAP